MTDAMSSPSNADATPRRRPELRSEARVLRSRANHRILFIAHYIIFTMTIALIWFTADFFAAVATGLAWGTLLSMHGFFAVLAPILRKKWTAGAEAHEAASISSERRSLEGKHARSLEELSASIAHEIRNPITAAKSLVAQMAEDPTSIENVEYARVALGELDRVERSIAHLLRFARDEEIEMGEARIIDVIDSAIEILRDRFDAVGITVTRDIDFGAGDSNGALRADAEKLRRVLINLFQNAIDALEESATPSPSIEVAAGENLAQTEVWLRLRDNGPGIPADRLARVFTPFYTSKEKGTGLGLAISKKIVDAHGGTLEAHNGSSGRGTELVMVLPKAGP